MNKQIKKYLSLFLSVTLLLGCFSFAITSAAEDEIAINPTNFPDPIFMKIVSSEIINTDGNESLSAEERNRSLISLSGSIESGESIKNLKGIEYFADSLKVLRCGGIGLEELDLSSLKNLTALTCQGNSLTEIDVSANTKLVTLNCAANMLEELNLGNLSSLQTLHCYANRLTSIDVSSLANLTDFRCDQNKITSLDISNNTKLQEFSCSMNRLTSLDLSHNTALSSATESSIGNQTVSAVAHANGVEIVIPFEVDNYASVTSSSLDDGDFSGYSGGEFVTYSVDSLENGIDYTYSTQLPQSEDMTVHIDVTRDFYQVSFYTAQDYQQLIGRSFVNPGESANNPSAMPQPEACKIFDRWSEDVSNVNSDMNVYIIWKDNHSYSLTNFDNGTATISCSGGCGDTYTVEFMDCVNAKEGDANYCEYLDVVDDGYINAKDYARLINKY